MKCLNDGCEYPDGECLFDELCDEFTGEVLVELAAGCLSIAEDELEDADDADIEDEDLSVPLEIVTDIVGDMELAMAVLTTLSRNGWLLSRK